MTSSSSTTSPLLAITYPATSEVFQLGLHCIPLSGVSLGSDSSYSGHSVREKTKNSYLWVSSVQLPELLIIINLNKSSRRFGISSELQRNINLYQTK